jgi:histone acetyltransferase (RNA polymerase elongator complex component)
MFNEQIFALLEAFSVTLIELGVQSFDNQVLQKSKRGHTAEDAEHTIQRLKLMGKGVGIHLMIGLPDDSYEKSIFSTYKTIALQPESVRIHPTLVIQGTQLEALYRRYTYTPLSLGTAVQTCKEMVKRFRAWQIPVIRIGLQPTDSMAQHIVAGPYHPAIRQLVESALMYEQMERLCHNHPVSEGSITFHVSPQDISNARGQKNINLQKLQQLFGFTNIRIMADASLQRGQLKIGE